MIPKFSIVPYNLSNVGGFYSVPIPTYRKTFRNGRLLLLYDDLNFPTVYYVLPFGWMIRNPCLVINYVCGQKSRRVPRQNSHDCSFSVRTCDQFPKPVTVTASFWKTVLIQMSRIFSGGFEFILSKLYSLLYTQWFIYSLAI